MAGKDLAELQAEVAAYQVEKGWANDGRSFAEECMLVASEVSELFEAWRKNREDEMGGEVADCFIRLLGLCETWGFDLQAEYEQKMKLNRGRPWRHGNLKV